MWVAAAAIVVTVAALAGIDAADHSGSSPSAAPATTVVGAAPGVTHGSPAGDEASGAPSKSAVSAGSASGAGSTVKAISRASSSEAGPPPSARTEQGAATGLGSSSTPTSPDQVPSLPSKVIETGSMSLQVGHGQVQSVVGRLTDLAGAEGGFVSSSSTNAGSPPSGDVAIRVPVARFANLLDAVRQLGTVESVNTSGQDVTSQYVDLQARIQSLQDSRSQFETILTKAYTIGDILSVENQIADLQTQIEQLQGQLQVLDDQTSYSTLTVQVAEAPKPAVVVPPVKSPSGVSKAWAHARHSFTHGIEAVIGASGGIAVFLIFAALSALVGRVGWLRWRRYLV